MSAQSPQARRKFGVALKAARRARGLSQRALGALIPSVLPGATVVQATVSSWEKGTTVPSVEQLFHLEAALDLPPGHLSRHLGLRPITTEVRVCMSDYIADDLRLGDRDKAILREMYEFLSQTSDEDDPTS